MRLALHLDPESEVETLPFNRFTESLVDDVIKLSWRLPEGETIVAVLQSTPTCVIYSINFACSCPGPEPLCLQNLWYEMRSTGVSLTSSGDSTVRLWSAGC